MLLGASPPRQATTFWWTHPLYRSRLSRLLATARGSGDMSFVEHLTHLLQTKGKKKEEDASALAAGLASNPSGA
jgi:hypothetical protein